MAEPRPRRWWVWTAADLLRHLENWPLLRHLLVERKFRYATAICALVVLLVILGLPKVWIVTPPGVSPVIRISWLNLLEAQIHASMARSAEAHDERETAFYHWQSATAFNPASQELLRGSISNLLHLSPRHAQRFAEARRNSFWLLQLTGTNSADLDLFTDVCEHFRADNLMLPLLTARTSSLSPHQQFALLKGSLRMGDQAAFRAARAKLPQSVAGEPELALFDAAAQAMWGSPKEAANGREILARSLSTSDTTLRVKALRLQLMVALTHRNLEDFREALRRLQDLHEDYPLEHAALWDLLQTSGRAPEASQLALEYAEPPVTSYEVIRLSESYLRLGLTNQATQFLEHFAPTLGNTSSIWLTYAELLIRAERWDEIRSLALEMRSNDLARSLVTGYSHYLEGLAELSTHHTNEAMLSFAKVPQGAVRDGELALRLARDLVSRGAALPAIELLSPREPELRKRPDYWRTLVRAAYARHDAELLLYAARRQFDLNPNRLDCANDLAAALIVNRRDPEEAVTLTRRVLDDQPTSVAARLNHALALLMAGNPAAAKALLLSIDADGLGEIENSMLAFAQVDLYRQQRKPAEALAALSRVNSAFLLPPQIAFLEQMRAEMETAAHPAGSP